MNIIDQSSRPAFAPAAYPPLYDSPRLHRLSSGTSLRALARKMGVSAMYLSDLERGQRQWSAAARRRWAKATGRPFPGQA